MRPGNPVRGTRFRGRAERTSRNYALHFPASTLLPVRRLSVLSFSCFQLRARMRFFIYSAPRTENARQTRASVKIIELKTLRRNNFAHPSQFLALSLSASFSSSLCINDFGRCSTTRRYRYPRGVTPRKILFAASRARDAAKTSVPRRESPMAPE